MSSIFISYRRAGTSGYGGRLQEDLRDHFGKDRVFRDIDSIRPGTDFTEVIEQAVAGAGVVLVLIGSNWLHATNESGARRLEDPDDFVRLEIESAIKREVVIVPVLVEGARMPSPSELPPTIGQLGRTQAIELTDERWDYDIGRLVEVLGDLVAEAPLVEGSDGRTRARRQARADAPPEDREVAGGPGGRVAHALRRRRPVVAIVASLIALLVGVVPVLARSSSPSKLEVPAVVELDATGATAQLTDAGFAVNVVTVPDDTKPGGMVLAQEPPGGTRLKKGGRVTLTVSGNTNKIAVPSVVTLTRAEAVKAIEAAGLQVVFDGKQNEAVAADTVFGQSPEPAVAVDKGTSVTITVSTGTAPPGSMTSLKPNGLPITPDSSVPGRAGTTKPSVVPSTPPTPATTATTNGRRDPSPGCVVQSNLIASTGSFEAGLGGWTTLSGTPRTRSYDESGSPPRREPWVGSSYAFGGPGSGAVIEQVASLASCPAVASGGRVLHYGGHIGGAGAQSDTVNLGVFFRAGGQDIGGCGMQPGTSPEERGFATRMEEKGYTACAIPKNADQAGLRVQFTSDGSDGTADGSYENAYIWIQ